MLNISRDDAIQRLIALLQGNDAIGQLSLEQIVQFAEMADMEFCRQGSEVIKQGELADHFYVVITGELRAIDPRETPRRLLNYHTAGSIVGLRGLLQETGLRAATVEVVQDAVLAKYTKEDLEWLLNERPEIKEDFLELERLFDERSLTDFPGRQPDEVVVAAIKRHVLAFIARLTWPIGFLIVPILFFLGAELIGISSRELITENLLLSLVVVIPFILLAGLSLAYNYFDWINDDLIVTTKRVIHIERILFYGEERREVPLTQIQDVTVRSHGILDLFFDVDDIEIKTAATGIISVDNVPSAQDLSRLMLQEQQRARNRAAASDTLAVRQLIRERLDKNPLGSPQSPTPPAPKIIPPRSILPKVPIPRIRFGYFVPHTRQIINFKGEPGIVWRKHYFVLLGKVIGPIISTLIFLYLFVASLFTLYPFSRPGASWPVITILGVAWVASIVWYFWQYDGWWRDTYIVTGMRIVDVDSSPFRLQGESLREGTFDSIQNITYNIPNFFYKLLNLGDVVIETAGAGRTFTFNKVFKPSQVQDEIFKRWDVFQQRRREMTRDTTNKQVVNVLGEYHDMLR
jgi:hypothetical protein